MTKEQHMWFGEENRQLQLLRPCTCGCDVREGIKGVGYLTASDSEGIGFTLWIEDEGIFNSLRKALNS